MAQVILKKNIFVGYRIRKSPNHKTPVFVPDEYLDALPADAVIVSYNEEPYDKEPEQPVEDTAGFVLRDLDELRVSEAQAQDRLEDISVSRITANAQRLINQHNLDPDAIVGTGKNDRVTQQDVLDYIETSQ